MSSAPTILAIETATSSCSAALYIDGQTRERSEIGNNVHSQVLLTMISELSEELGVTPDQLDAVAVGQGPGSFTGLRIGVGVGQGIAYGADCPMIGVSSLDALAVQSAAKGHVVAAIDARMGELYWCEYRLSEGQANFENKELSRIGSLNVSPPAELSVSADAVFVGNAWDEYSSDFSAAFLSSVIRREDVIYPSASTLLELAIQKYRIKDWIAAAEFKPIYVRDNVAKKARPKA